jgi:DNA polymerase-3 subunit beta
MDTASALHASVAAAVTTAAESPAPGIVGAPANDQPVPARGTAVIDRAAFLSAVTAAVRVVEKRNTLPILGNVLIRQTDDGLTVTGTDLDMETAVKVPGAVDPGFAVTVPGHTLLDILKRAKASDMVGLDYTDTAVEVEFDGLRIKLQGLPAADFPKFKADFSEAHRFSIPRDELRRLFAKTEFAISTESVRYYLNGVFLHSVAFDGSVVLRAVATDGHRLSHQSVPVPLGAGGMPGVIVPRKTVGEILHHSKPTFTGRGKAKVASGPERIGVRVTAAKIEFTIGDMVLTSKLVDGTFPDYGRVIPGWNPFTVRVDKSALAVAIDQVSVVSSERGRAVKLSFLDPGTVRLTVANPDTGTATTDVPAVFDDSDMPVKDGTKSAHLGEIGFNARYVLDLLANMDGDTVRFKLADPGSPTLVLDDGDQTLTMVLMPMRV